jgi:hypothetical protein
MAWLRRWPTETGCRGRAAPLQLLALVLGAALGGVGNLDQALTRVRAAVQHHVFDALAQHRLQVVVHADHAGVDDAHVHAGGNGVVQEHGVDGLAHRVVAAEAERHVGHAARHLGARQVLLDPARGLDEVHRVVVVLFNAGGDGEDVGVKDDVFRPGNPLRPPGCGRRARRSRSCAHRCRPGPFRQRP